MKLVFLTDKVCLLVGNIYLGQLNIATKLNSRDDNGKLRETGGRKAKGPKRVGFHQ